MWQPEPEWRPLSGGMGPSTVGVWLAPSGGGDVVVKRLAAPTIGDPPELSDPRHFAYWRRASDAALSGLVVDAPGLRSPRFIGAEEDAEGITIRFEWVPGSVMNGLFVAACLGRFAGAEIGSAPWLATNQLADRLARVERRGGWQTLARTAIADIAARLWDRRHTLMTCLTNGVHVPQHGDPVPANLPGRVGDDIVAIDWSGLGLGPVGADLGYYALSAKESFDTLLDAYLAGLPRGLATRAEVELGARITAVYTVLTRADWALSRVADGEGALAGKFRHPAVAPYLRAMQRQYPQIEALL
ncbi:MAG: phosphotransferase [Nocardioides sp.]